MYRYGNKSLEVLETLHPDLQRLMAEVIKYIDLTLISGHRDKLEQNILFNDGRSKLKYPKSKHNKLPSEAVDCAKWNKLKPHIRWEDRMQANYVAGYIKAIADRMDIKIRMGADWNNDMIFDESFYDPWHIELVRYNT